MTKTDLRFYVLTLPSFTYSVSLFGSFGWLAISSAQYGGLVLTAELVKVLTGANRLEVLSHVGSLSFSICLLPT